MDDAIRYQSLYEREVGEFMRRQGFATPKNPVLIEDSLALLRVRLINEEVGELTSAIHERNLIKIADGLGDLLYVTFGCALAYGLPIRKIFHLIHASNMTKNSVSSPGNLKSSTKGSNFKPPDLVGLLEGHCYNLGRNRHKKPGKCEKCGIERISLRRDRIIPGFKGGSYDPSNIQFLCANCHEDKTREERRGYSFPRSLESRKKQSESIKRYWASMTAEQRSLIAKARAQKKIKEFYPPLSEEHKKALREGHKKWREKKSKENR